MTALTLDLGTSATKAAVWDGAELVALTNGIVAREEPDPTLAGTYEALRATADAIASAVITAA